ncbi:hypothetical protein JAAARDRAFT_198085 [Jaapia argillacea MUCL 33604]|uniref:Uncharacterized protein n=1 Tax=Jaapia argillacea MUCL 33604 TaxID=933084 RepID=A0A067PCV3_9AGAM|nr:hypothetical protein JAAARDRAFT_198085 [Jaapia argillacea MUCL 33604]
MSAKVIGNYNSQSKPGGAEPKVPPPRKRPTRNDNALHATCISVVFADDLLLSMYAAENDKVDDSDALPVNQSDLTLQHDTGSPSAEDEQSLASARECIQTFSTAFREAALKNISTVPIDMHTCWSCGDLGDIIKCVKCDTRLCIVTAPTTSGCIYPYVGGVDPFNRDDFMCPLCHMQARTFPNYEILHTGYERYVFSKQIIPTAVITLTHGVHTSILRLQAQLAIAEEFRTDMSLTFGCYSPVYDLFLVSSIGWISLLLQTRSKAKGLHKRFIVSSPNTIPLVST